MARTQINLSFPRSRAALYRYLLGKPNAIIEAAFVFYQPIALIDAGVAKADVDEAIDEAIIKLRSHIEILEAKGRRYAGADNNSVPVNLSKIDTSPLPMKTEVTAVSPKKLVPDDEEDDGGTINISGGFNK